MTIFRKIREDLGQGEILRLSYDQRQRSRFHMQLGEREIQVILPRGVRPEHGLCLEAEDGSCLRIRAAEEELSSIYAENEQLARAAYHLGNRHLPAVIRSDSVSYLRDAVIDDMMKELGFDVQHHCEVFEAEPGAYSTHGHGHGKSQGLGHGSVFAVDFRPH